MLKVIRLKIIRDVTLSHHENETREQLIESVAVIFLSLTCEFFHLFNSTFIAL